MTAPAVVPVSLLTCGKIGERFTDRNGLLLTPICTLPVGHSQPCRWLKR